MTWNKQKSAKSNHTIINHKESHMMNHLARPHFSFHIKYGYIPNQPSNLHHFPPDNPTGLRTRLPFSLSKIRVKHINRTMAFCLKMNPAELWCSTTPEKQAKWKLLRLQKKKVLKHTLYKYLENLVYHSFRQRKWLVLGVKWMEINVATGFSGICV